MTCQKEATKIEHFTLQKGTIVNIAGLPVQLVSTAMVKTYEANAILIKAALAGSPSKPVVETQPGYDNLTIAELDSGSGI